MDLTLEKILRYLEDRMTPAEVKEFSLFLHQHPEARSLMDRVEKHLRIRRVEPEESLPDVQMVAAYLDGVLSPETVADLERKTLHDDLLLHELAASHYCQSSAPPVGNGRSWAATEGIDWERMRNLVKGGKSRPRSRMELEPTIGRSRGEPARLRINRKQVLVALGAFVVLAVSVVALTVRPRPELPRQVAVRSEPGQEDSKPPVVEEVQAKPAIGEIAVAPPPMVPMPMPAPMPIPAPMPKPVDPVPVPPPVRAEPAPAVLAGPPAADRETRQDLGKVVSEKQVVLRREADTKLWRRVAERGVVRSQDHLMALPGYAVEVRLDRGAKVTLWGNLPEVSNIAVLMESEINLLPAGAGATGELELLEGRVFLSGDGLVPVTWRVRFRDQVWDVKLADGQAEVMVEVSPVPAGRATWRLGEEPVVEALLAVTRGNATVTPQPGVGWEMAAAPSAAAFALWNSAQGMARGPFPLNTREPMWGRDWPGNPETQAVHKAALSELEGNLGGDRIPSVGMDLALNAKGATPALRHTALLALGCMGEHQRLLMDMSDETLTEDRRQAAACALRHWVSEEARRGLVLHNPKTDSGVLVDRFRMSAADAGMLVDLLHLPSLEEIRDRQGLMEVAELLQHDQLMIRVAAKRYLEDLAGKPSEGKALVRFDTRGQPTARRAATANWQKLIQEGRVPAQAGLVAQARNQKPKEQKPAKAKEPGKGP